MLYVVQNASQSISHLMLSAQKCSSLLLMISFNNPPSWYKAALCSSLSVFSIIAPSILATRQPSSNTAGITVVRMSVSYQQPLATLRSIRSPPGLLATSQVETMPWAQDLQVHSPHRCVCTSLQQSDSRQPYPVCPLAADHPKANGYRNSLSACHAEKASLTQSCCTLMADCF
jgi:hypothetical protein